VSSADLEARAETLRKDSATVLFVAADDRPACLIAVSDPIKATTTGALDALRADGIRIVWNPFPPAFRLFGVSLMHFGILVFQLTLRWGNIVPTRLTEASMTTHQPVASNIRIVSCDGYCEEIETPTPKSALPEVISNRDAKIRHDLESELQWDPRIDDRKIGVVVHHGIVTLTGEISSYSGRYAVEEIARRIEGVQAIANEVLVNLPAWGVRSDVDIAEAARYMLCWNVATRWASIQPIVSGGDVTLRGQVTWKFQREAAGKLVAELAGVRNVANLIEVKLLMPHRIRPEAI
jgi:osmotically-inducible protein OsmY